MDGSSVALDRTPESWVKESERHAAKGQHKQYTLQVAAMLGMSEPMVTAERRQRMTPTREGFDAQGHRGKADTLHSQIKASTTDDAAWPSPMASTNRKSTRALTASTDNARRTGGGNSSPLGLEQYVELTVGIVPDELPELDRLPPATIAQIQKAWPTASATDYKGSSQPGLRRGQLSEAANWPTPDATVSNDGEDLESWMARRERERARGQNGNGMGTPLAIAARIWPTTTSGDAKSSGSAGYGTESGRSEGTTLTDAAVRGIRAGATESKPTKGLKLNPAWVEQLMGFPLGWTLLDQESPSTTGKRRASSRERQTVPRASKPLETQSSRKSPRSSGDGS